jgi:UPF0176 protein
MLVGLVFGVAACGGPTVVAGTPNPGQAQGGGPVTSVAPSSVAAPAPQPEPSVDAKCPYLDSSFIADANGQRVGRVRLSTDTPHPACFFYRQDGKLQLSTQVYVGDADQAKALVDRVAPVATSNPAQLPDGWAGGAQATDSGAVFAVTKDGTAVVVTTNQAQTIKAKRVAEKTIAALGL